MPARGRCAASKCLLDDLHNLANLWAIQHWQPLQGLRGAGLLPALGALGRPGQHQLLRAAGDTDRPLAWDTIVVGYPVRITHPAGKALFATRQALPHLALDLVGVTPYQITPDCNCAPAHEVGQVESSGHRPCTYRATPYNVRLPSFSSLSKSWNALPHISPITKQWSMPMACSSLDTICWVLAILPLIH